MSASSDFIKRSMYHGLLPTTPVIYRRFLEDHFSTLPQGPLPPDDRTPAVQAFLDELEKSKSEKEIRSLFNAAVKQAEKYDKWADQDYKVKDFDDFLQKVNKIVGGPPKFYKAKDDEEITIGEPIGIPVYLIFDLIGNTSAGYTLLCRDDFNVAIRALLKGWGDYLQDEKKDSNSTLNKNGWFSDAGLAVLESGLGRLKFDETYQSNSDKDPKYKTWDSFFTRALKDGVRPITPQTGPGAELFYIYNPCESTAFRSAENVQVRDTFWVKSQNYSLYDMLGGDKYPELSKYAESLKGGSVLQSFLAPQDYHRWHSPIVGTVKEAKVLDGTYYAVLPDEGASEHDPDLAPGDPHGAIIRSQPWFSVSATRCVYIIEPQDTSPIELVAFIAIGMVEVSSCDITYNKRKIPDPDKVDVGTELGMFHFGGSSFALVVKPRAGHRIIFQDVYDSPVRPGQHRWVNSIIGQVRKDKGVL